MMTQSQIEDRARDKAFAQIHHLHINIDKTSNEIKHKMFGALTEEQLIQVLESEKRELKTWQFIAELIEKNNKDE
jgi:hypothetical protein